MLSVYQDNEVDLCMDELTEILADGPHFTSKETEKVAVAKDEGDGCAESAAQL